MQILVISDTHGSSYSLSRALLLHPDCEMVVHCGDGERELDAFLAEHPDWTNRVYHVCGNCDTTCRSPNLLTLDLPYGHRCVAVHGHMQQAGDFQANLVRLAKREGADIALFGHFHARCDQIVEGIHLFSPGSAAQPRDGLPPAYGLIDLFASGILTAHAEIPSRP